MKCKIKHCPDEAAKGFPACDALHGYMLKQAQHILKDLAYANTRQGLLQWAWYFPENPTIEDYLLYVA